MVHLETTNVTFTYPTARHPSLDQVSFQIKEGSFVLVGGPSGCGKTTLLRMLKPELRPHGSLEGTMMYQAGDLDTYASQEIGMIFQDPDHQIVMTEVLHELVFGMENQGLSSSIMKRRLAEIVQFFDIESLLHRKTDQLSGGEKQLLNLAGILLMKPKMILLDEPTAQLDPIASCQLLQMLEKLNKEWGITIVIVDHRLDELFPMVDHVLFLQAGRIRYDGGPKQAAQWLWNHRSEWGAFIPVVPKMFFALENAAKVDSCPLSVKKGREWWMERAESLSSPDRVLEEKDENARALLLECKDVSFRYQYENREILHHLDLAIYQGEALAILGRNGSGKSTLLRMIYEHGTPQRGRLRWHQKVKTAWLPQNPKSLFIYDQLRIEIDSICAIHCTEDQDREEILSRLQIHHLLDCHPYDLSGGELQRAALALLLCTKPQLLLLDEPTKGLDPLAKEKLLHWLRVLQDQGTTLVLVTHDLEFAAQFANRCALLFLGEMASVNHPSLFFGDSIFYATLLQRVLRGTQWSEILLWEEWITLCLGTDPFMSL